MAELALDDFYIEGYRGLRTLRLRSLGRVNLLTGKNNVGKTAVLEAVRIWAQRSSPAILRDVLAARNEWPLQEQPTYRLGVQAVSKAVRNLFSGRPQFGDEPFMLFDGEYPFPQVTVRAFSGIREEPEHSVARPFLHVGTVSGGVRLWLDEFNDYLGYGSEFPETQRLSPVSCFYVPSSGLDERSAGLSWDGIALTPMEDQVLDAIRIIAPEIERIQPVAGSNGDRRGSFRVRTHGSREPVQLSSMGDGISRILGISIALVSAQNGILLLDEIENGVHYTAQADLWRHIFRVSRDLNVQVFATTHSYDAVLAFQKAAQENEDEEGVLIRLNREGDKLTATVFDEADLDVVAREEIEVR